MLQYFIIIGLFVNGALAATLNDLTVVRGTTDSTRNTPLSWSATFSVEARYIRTGDIYFWSRVYCYESECNYPGPTIELVPGDNFTLVLENNLGPNPEGEDTTMNSMHSPNSTNMHTHGLHIDPIVDTVFVHASPGQTLTYNYKLPRNHAPGNCPSSSSSSSSSTSFFFSFCRICIHAHV
jgi:FtsP/CotA-like multicopper oxidase with cupredoxin domain